MSSTEEIRNSVQKLLLLLSSKQQQLEMQLKSPSTNVALELLCLWFNELCNPGSHLFERSFSETELKSIHEFNRYYDLRKGKVSETIEELHQDNDWEIIMQEAKRLFTEIK